MNEAASWLAHKHTHIHTSIFSYVHTCDYTKTDKYANYPALKQKVGYVKTKITGTICFNEPINLNFVIKKNLQLVMKIILLS